MDLRFTFNEDVQNYDRWRPAYVPALFEQVLGQVGEGPKSALEIGVGTGQATRPFLEAGYQVTAIDIGERMVAFTRRKFEAYPNFQAELTDFEGFCPNGDFDLVYSATAFHWIPAETGYPKALALLKPGGTLALFWNHPYVNRLEIPMHRAVQAVYQKYRPSDKPNPPEFCEKDCGRVMERLEQYGFQNSGYTLFYSTRIFTGEEYVRLMNTYSDHRALPPDVKAALEREMADTIRSLGDQLTIYDTIDLYLAQKPR